MTLICAALGVGAADTVIDHTKDTSPAAAASAFTDMPEPIVEAAPADLVIKHEPEAYYGASMEERFTAKGAPEIDYPVGPGTFVK